MFVRFTEVTWPRIVCSFTWVCNISLYEQITIYLFNCWWHLGGFRLGFLHTMLLLHSRVSAGPRFFWWGMCGPNSFSDFSYQFTLWETHWLHPGRCLGLSLLCVLATVTYPVFPLLPKMLSIWSYMYQTAWYPFWWSACFKSFAHLKNWIVFIFSTDW